MKACSSTGADVATAAHPIHAAPADTVSWKTRVQSAAMPSAPTATTVTTAPGYPATAKAGSTTTDTPGAWME